MLSDRSVSTDENQAVLKIGPWARRWFEKEHYVSQQEGQECTTSCLWCGETITATMAEGRAWHRQHVSACKKS